MPGYSIDGTLVHLHILRSCMSYVKGRSTSYLFEKFIWDIYWSPNDRSKKQTFRGVSVLYTFGACMVAKMADSKIPPNLDFFVPIDG